MPHIKSIRPLYFCCIFCLTFIIRTKEFMALSLYLSLLMLAEVSSANTFHYLLGSYDTVFMFVQGFKDVIFDIHVIFSRPKTISKHSDIIR